MPGFVRTLVRPALDAARLPTPRSPGLGSATDMRDAPLSVWFVDRVLCPEYDAYVAMHPEGTPFHLLDWRAALIDCRAGEPFYLMAMAGDRVVGVLPLLERAADQRLVLESLPHTPVAGVLADDARAARFLLERAARLALRRGAAAVVLRSLAGAAEAAAGDGERMWTRLPLAALRTRGGESPRAAPRALERKALAMLGPTQIAALSRIDPTIGVLAAWRGPSRAQPVCLLERAGPSLARPRAICLTHGEVARVFDAAGMDHTGAVRLAVLRQVASMVPAGCRWIECSLAPHERSSLVGSRPDGEVSVAAQQAFRPGELLSLVAAGE